MSESKIGKVVQVIGPVVDIKFDEASLPNIYNEIKIDMDKTYNVSINNIIFNKNEIENIGYMFRSDCFDMIINIDERDAILSNYKNEFKTQEYIKSLREFYKIRETTIQADLFNINEYDKDNIIQIIPQERKTKFEKNKFTILEIEV